MKNHLPSTVALLATLTVYFSAGKSSLALIPVILSLTALAFGCVCDLISILRGRHGYDKD